MNPRADSRRVLLGRAVDRLSETGIGDISLRALAADLDTSHRMVIYHFGSRDGLLAAVVDEVERRQREFLVETIDPSAPTIEQSRAFWEAVVIATQRYGPLFFELSAHAMQGREHAESLRHSLIGPWLPPLEHVCRSLGVADADCAATARLALGAARGLLFDLLLTGDRDGVDAAAEQLNRMLLLLVSPG